MKKYCIYESSDEFGFSVFCGAVFYELIIIENDERVTGFIRDEKDLPKGPNYICKECIVAMVLKS